MSLLIRIIIPGVIIFLVGGWLAYRKAKNNPGNEWAGLIEAFVTMAVFFIYIILTRA